MSGTINLNSASKSVITNFPVFVVHQIGEYKFNRNWKSFHTVYLLTVYLVH